MITSFSNFIKESNITYLNAASTETLEAKLEDLQLQFSEIQDEMSSIRSILNYRKTVKVEEFAKDLPDSIYEFNKEQLDFIFENHHRVNTRQHEIARTKYYTQLIGIANAGYNPQTNQTKFAIRTSSSFDETTYDFIKNNEQIKAIKFLGDNLKKQDNFVEFDVHKYFDDHSYNEKVFYKSDSEIFHGSKISRSNKFTNISDLLEKLVEEDKETEFG